MKLSLSGFLFEDDYTSQSVGFAEFCAIARSSGYSGVELRPTQVSVTTPGPQRAELRGIAHDAGLSVTCLTARSLPVSGPEREDCFLRSLALCQEMECALLKIRSDAHWLHQAATRAQDYGVTLAANNHLGTPLATVSGTQQFFHEVSHPNFGLLYDSLHLYTNGEDYLGCIPTFSGITRNILFHSMCPALPGATIGPLVTGDGTRWVSTLPGEPGSQDWPAIFQAFHRLRYDGLVTVIESGWPPARRTRIAEQCARFILDLWPGVRELPGTTPGSFE